MSDSLHPARLVCPKCGHEVKLDVPRVMTITYACEKCAASIEHSFLTGSVTVKTDPPPPSSD